MSNTNEILKHIITAPELNSTDYANNLKGVFKNINDNFVTLANRDFVKGERGSSVEIVEYDIFDNTDTDDTLEEPKYTEYGNLLIDAIKNRPGYSPNTEYIISNDVTVGLLDNLGSKAGKLKMICNITSEDGVNFSYLPVSSLYYVFLDGRFANDKINKMDESVFTDIEDLSCVLIYNVNENGKGYFEVLDNAFPTIYYEKEVGLCWKLNGNNTGIPVKGPQGKAGENAKLYIVKSDKDLNQNTSGTFEIEVTHIFDTNGFTTIQDYIKNTTDTLKTNTQYACVIYCNIGSGYNYYFGTLKYDNNKVIAISDSTISIGKLVQISTLENLFKNINLKANDGYNVKGIYLPIEEANQTQKVHLLTASSLTNEKGNKSSLNTDIIWSPVSDINTLDINDNYHLQVDKYLYLKVDTSLLTSMINSSYNLLKDKSYEERQKALNFLNIIISAFKYRNNILKYKLVNTLKLSPINKSFSTSNTIFNKFIDNSDSDITLVNNKISNSDSAKCVLNTNIKYSNGEIRQLGPTISIENLEYYGKFINILNDTTEEQNNIEPKELEYNDINNTYVYSRSANTPSNQNSVLLTKENLEQFYIDKQLHIKDTDRYSTTPLEFADIIFNNDSNKKRIYRWVLDFTYNEYDPEELKNSSAGQEKFGNSYSYMAIDNYSNPFNTLNIYTLFNNIFTTTLSPISTDNIMWFNGITKRVDYDGYLMDNTIKGWDLNPEFLKFFKFIPSFNNSYAIPEDTSLNLNYNVNITGDINNPKKNITVQGDIIADTLQVTNANINNIENIYTKNDIIGENGLKIGLKTENNNKNDSYYTVIDNIGSINCSTINTTLLNSTDIVTSTINTASLNSTEIIEAKNINTTSLNSTNISIDTDNISFNNYTDNNKEGFKIDFKNDSPNICIDSNNKINFIPNEYSNSNFEEHLSDIINNSNDNIITEIKTITFNNDNQTINRLNIDQNDSYIDSNETKGPNNKTRHNSGVTGYAYGNKGYNSSTGYYNQGGSVGHASGPYISTWDNNYWKGKSEKVGKLSKKDRFYKYTLFPYWDIPGGLCSLMSTPIPSSGTDRYSDRPFITNICELKIPLAYYENDIHTEDNFRVLNGIYKTDDRDIYKFDDSWLDYNKIHIELNNKIFTLLVHIFGNNNGDGAKLVNTNDKPSFMYLSVKASVHGKGVNNNGDNIEESYTPTNTKNRIKYEFPSDMLNKRWAGYSKGPENSESTTPINFSVTGEECESITNQFNIRFNNISFNYNNLLSDFFNVSNYVIGDHITNYYIKLRIYTELCVSFNASKGCMRELWLSPTLYYRDKNFNSNNDNISGNKPFGISVEKENWNGISFTPTLYNDMKGNIVIPDNPNTGNYRNYPWMSFKYLDKLCNLKYNLNGTEVSNNLGTYGPLDITITDDGNNPINDSYYKSNGFNGSYNGNNFNVKTKTYYKATTNINDNINEININNHNIIFNSKNKLGGMLVKDNDVHLLTTGINESSKKNELIYIKLSTLSNLVNTSSSLLTYGV